MADGGQELAYGVDDRGVASIVLNRPHRRNAFTLDMIAAWVDALDQATRDSAVRVVVLRATGKAFCAGLDIGELDKHGTNAAARKALLTEYIHHVPLAVDRLDKPIIAAVNGSAVGAGMDMSLMCDLRVAGTSATFCEGYIKIGLVPGVGGCHYLPRLVGTAKALELLWTGDTIDAPEALRLGLVNRVVPDTDLVAETDRLAGRIAAAPRTAVSVMKRAVYQGAYLDVRTSLDLISSHLAVVQATPESEAAVASARARFAPAKETDHR
ncbi:MAG: enoyl-CoA hydratase/isomerase family protein [Solirubrobacterales bacterium]|nr:enoyl-CoA hydratase/isomerase family protein [Solirubrobacterales bacterium]